MAGGQLSYGFGFFVILLIGIIHMTGSAGIDGAQLMAIPGVLIIIFVLPVYYYILRFNGINFTIYDLSIEHFFLIDQVRPIAKWFAFSAHMVWMTTMNMVNAQTITLDAFIGMHVYNVLLAIIAVIVYNTEVSLSQNNFIKKSTFFQYMFSYPIFIVFITMAISGAIISAIASKPQPSPSPDTNQPAK